jgi:hypothetical protein
MGEGKYKKSYWRRYLVQNEKITKNTISKGVQQMTTDLLDYHKEKGNL